MLTRKYIQPDDASERDKRRLAEELHIATVIDLRSQYVEIYLHFAQSLYTQQRKKKELYN